MLNYFFIDWDKMTWCTLKLHRFGMSQHLMENSSTDMNRRIYFPTIGNFWVMNKKINILRGKFKITPNFKSVNFNLD